MPASISRRAFIQWQAEIPSEPTSTIVLTSPQSRYVDVRLLQADTNDSTLTPEQVDWAFAGTSRNSWRDSVDTRAKLSKMDLEAYRPFVDTTKAAPMSESANLGTLDRVQHTEWTHVIDSKHSLNTSVQDEGDMIPLTSLGLTLELGNMSNPETGKASDYVEGWTDEHIVPADYAVFELIDQAQEAKGTFIKLGAWMQGVFKMTDNTFALERWHKDIEWTLQGRLGEIVFPADTASKQKVHLDQTVNVDGAHDKQWQWKVVEAGTI